MHEETQTRVLRGIHGLGRSPAERAKGTGAARQTGTARGESSGDEGLTLIEQVVRRENLVAAHARVVRNGGAPGVDGMTVDDLMPYCRQHWARIREQLLSGTYVPQPVRRVEIPKPDGKGRADCWASPRCSTDSFNKPFCKSSRLSSTRPSRTQASAFGRAGARIRLFSVRREYIAAGHRWVVDVDLEKFFDRVNHDVLMARVARRVKDKRALRLIRRYLQAGMMEDGLVSPRTEGTPQGGPLSPLLSNILLDEWDRELDRRGHRFVRYADDCNVYVRSKAAGERVLASLERWLTQRLRLRVNREKSGVARPWTRKFLGYSVTWDRAARLRVAPAAVKRLKTKLRGILRQGRGRRLADTVTELNLATRGWVVYFRLAEAKTSFEDLDKWLRRKLRGVVWRQWKRPRTRLHELRRRGLDETRARVSAYNGHGPWWNAGASHMHAAVPTAVLRQLGLLSLLDEHQRLARAL